MPKYSIYKKDYEKMKGLADKINSMQCEGTVILEVLESELDIMKVKFRANLGRYNDLEDENHCLNIGNGYIVIGKRDTLNDKLYEYLSKDTIYEYYLNSNLHIYDIEEFVHERKKEQLFRYLNNCLVNENINLVKCKCGKFKENDIHYYVYNATTNDLKLVCSSCLKKLAKPKNLRKFLSVTQKLSQLKKLLKDSDNEISFIEVPFQNIRIAPTLYDTKTFIMAVIKVLDYYKIPYTDRCFTYREPTWVYAKNEYYSLSLAPENHLSRKLENIATKVKDWYFENIGNYIINPVLAKQTIFLERDLAEVAEIVFKFFLRYGWYDTAVKEYSEELLIPLNFQHNGRMLNHDLIDFVQGEDFEKYILIHKLAYLNKVYDRATRTFEYRFTNRSSMNTDNIFILKSQTLNIEFNNEDFYRTFEIIVNQNTEEIVVQNDITMTISNEWMIPSKHISERMLIPFPTEES